MPRRPRLKDAGAYVYQSTRAFFADRLAERETLQWAIDLTHEQTTEQAALRDLFELRQENLSAVYKEAWRWIFEYWQRPNYDDLEDRFYVRRALKAKSAHPELIRIIVSQVKPWINVEDRSKRSAIYGESASKTPRTVNHLLSLSVTSGEIPQLEEIGFSEIDDDSFLIELANQLDTALLSGLFLAKRIGFITDRADSTNWQVRRVYLVPAAQYPAGGGEPDRHARGFAPISKLLYSLIERLAELDLGAAKRIIAGWDLGRWKLHKRLWAASARDRRLVDATEVGEFLTSLTDQEFWQAGSFPEIAELRATRWNELDDAATRLLEKRLLRGQPLAMLPARLTEDEASGAIKRNLYTELSRIVAGNGLLSGEAMETLTGIENSGIPLPQIDQVAAGFNPGVRILASERPTQRGYHKIERSKLLRELDKDLAGDNWSDSRQAASDFIQERPDLVVELLETQGLAEGDYSNVWNALGYYFRRRGKENDTGDTEMLTAERLCTMLSRIAAPTLRVSIEGLSEWLSNWAASLRNNPAFFEAWHSLWPAAVENANQADAREQSLSDRALTSPAGRMAEAFKSVCPPSIGRRGALNAEPYAKVLKEIEDSTGDARLQARYVMIPAVSYFLLGAPDWTTRNLIKPLAEAEGAELELWTAFIHGGMPYRDVVEALAQPIIRAAINPTLSDDSRGELASVVLWSAMSDRSNGKEPVFAGASIQQLLRMGGEVARIHAIRTMEDFLQSNEAKVQTAPEVRFDKVVQPLFEEVWPKEKTLATKGTSDAFASLPVAAGRRFAKAVHMVLPYMAPFDCWSLSEFRIYDRSTDERDITAVKTKEDATAFLVLLDASVSGAEGAVVPYGLDKGLDHLKQIAPSLERDVAFQRLLALARR
ncbi:hypothetical protein [Sinorhizobium meliloti]|uniref:hypothetical protein n=1 Tax=Rhizobium meliloti TaxID=382 RepID=UPI003DA13C34